MNDLKYFDNKELNLILAMEECGEVIQACSKMLRFGEQEVYKGRINSKRLGVEIGDLLAILEILIYNKQAVLEDIEVSSIAKISKLKKFYRK